MNPSIKIIPFYVGPDVRNAFLVISAKMTPGAEGPVISTSFLYKGEDVSLEYIPNKMGGSCCFIGAIPQSEDGTNHWLYPNATIDYSELMAEESGFNTMFKAGNYEGLFKAMAQAMGDEGEDEE